MIDRQVVPLLELQAVKAACQVENSFLHGIEPEIGLEQFVIQVIALLLVFLRPIAEVPGHQLARESVRLCVIGNLSHVVAGSGQRGLHQPLEEGLHGLLRLRHALFQCVGGIGRIAEQLRLLGAQGYDLADQGGIVVFSTDALAVVSAPHLLAQVAAGAEFQERAVAGLMEGKSPAFFLAGGSFRGGQVADETGQTFQLGFIGQVQRKGIGGGQHVLPELQGGQGQFFRNFSEALLPFRRQVGAVAGEGFPGLFQ